MEGDGSVAWMLVKVLERVRGIVPWPVPRSRT